MKVIIDIPKDFTGDYIVDKFKDFFSRVIADVDCKGMCGRYEKEIAEMFLKAFEESEEKMKCDECKNANICLDHREEETLVGCTSGMPDRKVTTNADRIRNMSDEELANIIFNDSCIAIMKLEECPHANDHRADIHNVCKECIFEWLQSEAE